MIMFMKKTSTFLILAILLMWGMTLGLIFNEHRIAQTASLNLSGMPVVVIDPGHGGVDGGTQGTDSGVLEKDINLAIAMQLKDVLEYNGIKVVMTRSDDRSIHSPDANTIRKQKVSDLKNRVELMRTSQADIYISIHMNSFEQRTQRGAQVFFSNFEKEKSMLLAQSIQNNIQNVAPYSNKPVKKALSNVYIMKHAVLPSVLIECGFLSNPEDETLLSNPAYQERLAAYIAKGVEEYYNTIQ